MSYLEKLSIQGIRSFDPEHHQVLQFYSPLTIILGPNGAGKTSIIESLRYVTTGEHPPNSNRGKTFVHDPSFANVSTVRGQVKLKFVDVGSHVCVVTRSLEANQRKIGGKPQLTTKTLDSVLKRDNHEIDSRCAVIDTEMLSLFGVSKAVITNVVFCHQEDSNWPLSEGKVLKEKFDDIFGSMGYVKALEKIRKLRKDEKNREKIFEKELETFTAYKEQCDDHNKRLKSLKTRYALSKDEIHEFDQKLTNIRSQLNEMITKESSLQQIQDKISQLTGIINEKKRMVTETKKNVKNQFKGQRDELKNEIDNFETNVEKEKHEKNSLIKKRDDIGKDYDMLMQRQQLIAKEIGKLEQTKDQCVQLISERRELLSNMCKDENINIDSHDINDNKINEIEELIYDNFDALKVELNKIQRDNRNNESSLQRDCESIKEQLNKAQHEMKLRDNDLSDKKKRLNDIELQICRIDSSQDRYSEMREDIKGYNEKIKLMQQTDIQKLKDKVQDQVLEKNRLKVDIGVLESELKRLNEEKEQRVKYEITKKAKNEKEEKLKNLTSRHSEIMKKVGISSDSGGFHKALDNLIRAVNSRIEKIEEAIASKENALSGLGTRVEIDRDSITKKKKELENCETMIKKLCGNSDFDDVFNRTEDELKILRDNCSDVESSKKFYIKQIENINKTQCCPVCERSLSSEWTNKDGEKLNQRKLIKQMQNNIDPAMVEDRIKKLREKENIYASLLALKPKKDLIQKLKNEIPVLNEELNKNLKDVNDRESEISKLKCDLKMKKSEVESLRSVLMDASEYDNCINEIKKIDYQISRDECQISSNTRSEEEVNADLQTKRDEFYKLDTDIPKNQNTIKEHNDKLNKINFAKISAENEILKLESDQQNRVIIEKQRDDLKNDVEKSETEIKNLQNTIVELKPKLANLEIDKQQIIQKNKQTEDDIQNKIKVKEEKFANIKRITNDIDKYKNSGLMEKAKDLRTKELRIKEEIEDIETSKKSLNDSINDISERISNNEVRKRELCDCLKLIDYQNEIDQKEKELNNQRKELGYHNIEDLKKQKRSLEIEERKFDNEKQQMRGKQEPIIEQMKDIEKALRMDKYKSAETNYKHKLYEWETCTIAGEDLNKYYKALDFAVTNFHQRKMQEINKLIQGFWKQAYRGKDIDYIKITSDEEERSAEKRRNYNYRVVMVKGNSEMDMRGRCSAGQKVLASLIIRLALAEIFCANCSVLALDEPTTNLDKDNINSFANAIGDIVKYRSQKKNSHFQLIIITHDEEFLSCLNDETGQYYYKVFKDNNAHSKILRKSIHDKIDDDGDNDDM